MNASYWEENYWPQPYDFLIIGMGLTGLRTGLELRAKQPKARIAVVDRHAWSKGASLRNAGFACFANIGEILDDLNHISEEEVYSLCKQRYEGIKWLNDELGSRIDLINSGSFESFSSNNKHDLERSLDYLQRANTLMYDLLGLDVVFSFSSNSYIQSGLGSIQNKYEGELNTAKLYAALIERSKEAEIALYGGCTYQSHTQTSKLEVHFEEGHTLKTSHLLLCTNAMASSHTSEDVLPARGLVIVSEQIEGLELRGTHMFNKGYYYWRAIDQKIMLGGARNIDKRVEETTEFGVNQKIYKELKRFLIEEILDKEVQIGHKWSGIMAMSKGGSKKPLVKKLEPNIYLGARLGGMGVALSADVGAKLADLVLNP